MSYGFAITAVFVTIIVYFATGARFRVRAFVDQRAAVAVEFYNRGRLADTLQHVALARKVPRKMRQDGNKSYDIKAASGLPLRLEPGGFTEIRFDPVDDLDGVFVSIRYGAGNYHRTSLRSVVGELPELADSENS